MKWPYITLHKDVPSKYKEAVLRISVARFHRWHGPLVRNALTRLVLDIKRVAAEAMEDASLKQVLTNTTSTTASQLFETHIAQHLKGWYLIVEEQFNAETTWCVD